MTCAGGFVIERMGEFEAKRVGELETIEGLPKTKLLQQVQEIAPQLFTWLRYRFLNFI